MSAHLKLNISQHKAHIDHRDFELTHARADMTKINGQNETLTHEVQFLRNNEIYAENKHIDIQRRAEERYDLLLGELR
eukprot:5500501-Heterocapsa_arctica.AAC.1